MARKHLTGRELQEKVKRSVAIDEKKRGSLFFKTYIYNYKRESSFSMASRFWSYGRGSYGKEFGLGGIGALSFKESR